MAWAERLKECPPGAVATNHSPNPNPNPNPNPDPNPNPTPNQVRWPTTCGMSSAASRTWRRASSTRCALQPSPLNLHPHLSLSLTLRLSLTLSLTPNPNRHVRGEAFQPDHWATLFRTLGRL